jgi:hypothetical protein
MCNFKVIVYQKPTIMKKITMFLVLAVLLYGTAMAQKIRFGIQAGAVLSDQSISGDGIDVSFDSKIGATFGLMADKQIGKSVGFQTALNYVMKGYEFNESGYGDFSVTLNYLEIPLNFLYRPNAEKGFFIGGGPSFAFGLGGKAKSGDEEEDIEFGGEDNYKSFDFGLNLMAGYLLSKNLQIALNYNLGLSNIAPSSADDEGTLKNNYFGLRLGYFFK